MNIDELKAGRELDALIAERVMGWHKGENIHGCEGWMWNTDKNEPSTPKTWDKHWIRSTCDTPEYSTSIADAWLVVEKMKEGKFHLELRQYYDNRVSMDNFSAKFWTLGEWIHLFAMEVPRKVEDHDHEYKGFPAPLAICKAALRAVYKK